MISKTFALISMKTNDKTFELKSNLKLILKKLFYELKGEFSRKNISIIKVFHFFS